jgi:transcriptional regulator with XRE-family HTH domain
MRLVKGLSQPELATKLDVSNGSVGSWETGPTIPRPDMLKKIAALLDTSVGYLMNGEPDGPLLARETSPPYQAGDMTELFEAIGKAEEALANVRTAAEKIRAKGVSSKKDGPGGKVVGVIAKAAHHDGAS